MTFKMPDREGPVKLNLGCGTDIRRGWVNIDHRFPNDAYGVKVQWDLNELPLPFEGGSVEEIEAHHVLEHLWEWEYVVIDCHRMLKPGGLLRIIAPYGFQPCAGHKRFFTERSMDFFLSDDVPSNDLHVRFDLVRVEHHRPLPFRWHLEHYLGLKLPHRAREIIWELRK